MSFGSLNASRGKLSDEGLPPSSIPFTGRWPGQCAFELHTPFRLLQIEDLFQFVLKIAQSTDMVPAVTI